MLAQVNHDLQLGHQCLDVADIRLGLDHLDGHRGARLPGHDARGLRLQNSSESPGSKEDSQIKTLCRELKVSRTNNQFLKSKSHAIINPKCENALNNFNAFK